MAKQIRKRRPPGATPEARENQLINQAIDLAEKQLLDGTASSQIICHYLKLGTTKEAIEKELLISKNKLTQAKVVSLESSKHSEELYKKALNAMRLYDGKEPLEEDED